MAYRIRPMSFGEILDTGFTLLRDRFDVLAGLAAIMYLPLGVISALWAAISPGSSPSVTMSVTALVTVLVVMVASPIVYAATTFAIGETIAGRPVTIGGSLNAGWSIIMPLMGTTLLAGLGILGGLLLLVVPGVYFMLAWMLMWQVMVIERRFGLGALRRSRELMRGHLARGCGVLFVGGLIISVLTGILNVILTHIPFLGPMAAYMVQGIGGAYTATLGVLLYFDIRCRKEGLDVQHLAQAVRGAPMPAVSPAR